MGAETAKQLRDRRSLDGRRVKARLIDGLIIGFPSVVVAEVLGLRTPLALMLLLAASVTYFFVCEATTGYTIGKYQMGLRVIKPDGGSPNAHSVAARNVIRILEEPILALLVMVLSGGRRQRIGDFVGTTAVGSVVYADPPERSRMRLIYPAIWVAGAIALGLFLNPSYSYVNEVNRTCAAQVSRMQVNRPPFALIADVNRDLAAEVRELEPPRFDEDRGRAIVAEFDSLHAASNTATREIEASPTPKIEFPAAYARYSQKTMVVQSHLMSLGVDCRDPV